MRFFIVCVVMLLLMHSCSGDKPPWKLSSPDNDLTAEVWLDAGVLMYRVTGRDGTDEFELVRPSPLGLERSDASFSGGLRWIEASKSAIVDQSYTLVHGKRSSCRDHARERTLTLENRAGNRLQLVLRAYKDGIAFRYRFPEEESSEVRITGEITSFHLPAEGRAFMQPHDEAGQWTPAYETFYQRDLGIGTASPSPAGWSFPALFEIHGGHWWVLLTEAALDRHCFGARLDSNAPEGRYKIRMPDAAEGQGTGPVEPVSTLPWTLPWRVLLIGKSAGDIVESSLITHLNPPGTAENTDWIRPGRVSWSWWSAQDSPRDPDQLKTFVDLAAEMGWEYSLVDANWNYVDEAEIRDLAAYAAAKGVGLLFWYNSGGPHNIVTEAPRDRLSNRASRRREFQWLKALGAVGVKVDFFQSDKQTIISHYLDILEDAAEARLMVNFHGCTLPRGWSRTYPHLMSMEAVRGAECYIFDSSYPEKAPWHNTVLPFTRNAVGPMDYTPVTFSENVYPHLTRSGHELALAVVFESGWQHFADRVKTYRDLDEPVKAFLKWVPASWDDIRFLAGEPGRFVVLARRSGRSWAIGAINGGEEPVTINTDLPFLEQSGYSALEIYDGADPRRLESRQYTLTSPASLEREIPPRGGFVIRLQPGGAAP